MEDGAIPLRTKNIMNYYDALKLPEPLQNDPEKPFSHLTTGMVLRAFAAHPMIVIHQKLRSCRKINNEPIFPAGEIHPPSREESWESVSSPFWFTNILTSLDSLQLLGFGRKELHKLGLSWLVER